MLKTIALVLAVATPAAWAANETLSCAQENTKLSPDRMAEIAALM
jgi:hypothetical protein